MTSQANNSYEHCNCSYNCEVYISLLDVDDCWVQSAVCGRNHERNEDRHSDGRARTLSEGECL